MPTVLCWGGSVRVANVITPERTDRYIQPFRHHSFVVINAGEIRLIGTKEDQKSS